MRHSRSFFSNPLTCPAAALANPQFGGPPGGPPGGFTSGCSPFNAASCTSTSTSASTSTSTTVLAAGANSLTSTRTDAVATIGTASSDPSTTSYANGGYGGSGSGGSLGGTGSANGNGSPGSSLNPIYQKMNKVTIAHAVLAGLAWVIFFPLGGIIIRIFHSRHLIWIHAAVQVFSYAMFIAAVGTGIWLAQQWEKYDDIWNDPHPIIGLVVFGLLFFQPILGLVHHHIFKSRGVGKRTVWAYAHVWLGRILITLGIINGGLGLQLAGKSPMQSKSTTRQAEIGYGIVAGMMWLVYMVVIMWSELPRRKKQQSERPQMWVRTFERGGAERKDIDSL